MFQENENRMSVMKTLYLMTNHLNTCNYGPNNMEQLVQPILAFTERSYFIIKYLKDRINLHLLDFTHLLRYNPRSET